MCGHLFSRKTAKRVFFVANMFLFFIPRNENYPKIKLSRLFFQSSHMGVIGFYPWLKKIGYVPKQVRVEPTQRLLVDVKMFMYKYAFGITTQTDHLDEDIASAIIRAFRGYVNVTFVNDGQLAEDHMKSQALEVRAKQRARDTERAKRTRDELEEEETAFQQAKKQRIEEGEAVPVNTIMSIEEAEQLEKVKRAARGVKSNVSRSVLEILEKKGYNCIQCEDCEADTMLKQLFAPDTKVVSDDSDLIISGCDVLRNFAQGQAVLYVAKDILSKARITQSQLQQMACLAGCDYMMGGLRGMGLLTAHKFMLKFKSLDQMLIGMNKEQRRKYPEFNTDFVSQAKKAITLF